MNVIYFHSKYKTSTDSYEFSLNRYDIYEMNLELFDNRIVSPDMSDYCSDMGFFNTIICGNSSAIRKYLRCPEGIVKTLKILI